MRAPSTAPTTVPRPRCSARANTEPKSGRSTIATVSITQYERCRANSWLTTAATPMEIIRRSAKIRGNRPPDERAAASRIRSRSGGRRSTASPSPRRLPASRSTASPRALAIARVPGLLPATAGAGGTGPSPRMARAIASITAITPPGGRSPSWTRVVAASVSG